MSPVIYICFDTCLECGSGNRLAYSLSSSFSRDIDKEPGKPPYPGASGFPFPDSGFGRKWPRWFLGLTRRTSRLVAQPLYYSEAVEADLGAAAAGALVRGEGDVSRGAGVELLHGVALPAAAVTPSVSIVWT